MSIDQPSPSGKGSVGPFFLIIPPLPLLLSISPFACGWTGQLGEDSLFKGVQGHLTRNNGMEFSKGQFMLNYKRNFLTVRSIRLENRLPGEGSAIAGVI